jgi:UDP-glucose 4-epimerase
MYEQINHIEAVKLAQKAKKCGVKHFVFMSSMSVYGIKSGEIKADSVCAPVTLYGKSKLAAERDMQELSDDSFVVTAIRAPMVYGRACPGNFGTLKRFAAKSPIFPRVNNKRSMIYIGNLTELIYRVVVAGTGGVILPMDGEYINTSDMVKTIANGMGRKIYLSGLMGFIVQRIHFGVFEKVFGSLYYADEVALKCDRFAVKDAVEKSL